MPIHNLTNVPRSFLKLGQIRKGAPKGQNMPGKDLDYFRVTFLKGRNSEFIEARFREVYGDKPTAINIRFADHTLDSVWDANYECYKKGGLVAKAGSNENGLYWIFYRHPKTMETLISDGRARNQEGLDLQAKPIDLTQPIYKNEKDEPFFMEPVGRLKVVIPELADLAVGYFEFRPESPRDIRNVSAEMGVYDSIAKQYGKTIAGIPFVLVRREEDTTARIDGKLVAKKSWVVHLDVLGEWGARALNVLERLALPEIVEGEEIPPQLEPGDIEADPFVTDLHPMTLEEALQVKIVTTQGNEKTMAGLTDDQLNRVILKSTDPRQVEAAKIIIMQDKKVTPV